MRSITGSQEAQEGTPEVIPAQGHGRRVPIRIGGNGAAALLTEANRASKVSGSTEQNRVVIILD
jgi:hypothetical protein